MTETMRRINGAEFTDDEIARATEMRAMIAIELGEERPLYRVLYDMVEQGAIFRSLAAFEAMVVPASKPAASPLAHRRHVRGEGV